MAARVASPTCGLMHDSASANTQANHSRWYAQKCLMNNTDCVCHGDKVGAGFERRDGGTGANPVSYGARATCRRHSQSGPEPHTVCGTRIRKRPKERGWALNFGGRRTTKQPAETLAAQRSTKSDFPICPQICPQACHATHSQARSRLSVAPCGWGAHPPSSNLFPGRPLGARFRKIFLHPN
jgi:hypothetical protein